MSSDKVLVLSIISLVDKMLTALARLALVE